MLIINGEVRYEFSDLVARSGYLIASKVWDGIGRANECDRYVNVETGEISYGVPTPLNRGALLDEIGWEDVCGYADLEAAEMKRFRR